MLLRNGLIHDAIHREPYIGDILIESNKIKKIAPNIEIKRSIKSIDLSGYSVYPGFVEAHCHLGLDNYGIGFEGQDYNEKNDIVTPELRAIDSINPQDPTFEMAAKAGVTCVCTGPGSTNVLGGSFAVIKTVGNCVDNMIVVKNAAMKCSFGENPKTCYKDKSNYTRMSTAAKLREMLYRAQEYDEFFSLYENGSGAKPAFNMKLHALLPVIRRQIPLKAHAHRADDICTAIRIAQEFNLKLTIEHCTEGHLIPDVLSSYDYPLAIGPTFTHATKFELRNKSWDTVKVLSEAKCKVSIITDSPVIPESFLPLCAGFAVKAGMDPFLALQAITINPARHIGADAYVGSIEPGKHADIVITDGDPLISNTSVLMTIINGRIVFRQKI